MELLMEVAPLLEAFTDKVRSQIKDGSAEVVTEPTQEQRLGYQKTLQAYRISKLKRLVASKRADLLKKVYQERTKEI